MEILVFILGSPNSNDGLLSSISTSRIERAIGLQTTSCKITLMCTGGFGDHFNKSPIPHRNLVHEYLLSRGASIDAACSGDLLSSNTVEDALMIAAFASRRNLTHYGIVTSAFHLARCRYIFECLAPEHRIDFYPADNPPDIDPSVGKHEADALARLVAQGGVLVDGIVYSRRPRPFGEQSLTDN